MARKVRLVLSGYETLTVLQPIPTPWYEYPGLDFVTENLVPGEIRDEPPVVEFQLQPQIIVPSQQLLSRAENLRQGAGSAIGARSAARLSAGWPELRTAAAGDVARLLAGLTTDDATPR